MILFDRALELAAVTTDRHDSRASTAALPASHDTAQGRITMHPTPATCTGTALAYDILAVLGKPTDRFGGFHLA
ncbi:hypothetical protein GCM10010277_80680 [Streptomyces longisporoflavus]|uniref:hypothetical protein n=1 Tax=Streptomyces longisporoflavus TaxID=28044 RepID=UPI00167E0F7A|nr:hypothetical protein [Streptomyces longisporoflavus]GGV70088.1 hypothetical protein GCM10010277_80680 [Streptomyces longisporoflavus]